jgi:hypothetical protein
MFFKKKSNAKCDKCKSSISEEYSFCPYCGNAMLDAEKNRKEYGLLGKNDALDEEEMQSNFMESNLGITDKIVESIFNSMMKNVEKQIRGMSMKDMQPEIRALPNGIKIRIGPAMPVQKQKERQSKRREISEETLGKLTSMPKTTAKSHVRRFSDKVVYELDIPGISSPEDVIFTKLENGYEVKAIGSKKVYVNSLPLELPLKGFAIEKDKLLIEFLHQQR